MKILLITLEYPPQRGGVGRYYHELVQACPRGSVEVLVPKLSSRIWPKWWPVGKQIRARAKHDHFDVIWVGQILPLGTVAWLKRLFGGQPYFVSTHGLDILLPQQNRWKKWLVRQILKRALLITANSQYTVQQLAFYKVAKAKILLLKPAPTTLPNVDDHQIELFKQQYSLTNGPIILAVGRLVRRKGFDILVSIMPQIWSVIPSAQLVIIGDGPERLALTKQIEPLSTNQVQLITQASDTDLAAAYGVADVFVLPARSDGADVEGFGIVCLEAAQFGVPVVATASGGIGEAVQHGQTGVLIAPNDTSALVNMIIDLLQNQGKRQAMGAAGQNWTKQFSWQRNAEQLLKELNNRL